MPHCIQPLSPIIILPVLVLLTLAPPLTAQQPDEVDIFELSPFVVDASRDVGYRSTNSTSGTALNTPLKDLPMTVQVINYEFISDIAATNFDEALAYASGVFTTDLAGSSGTGSANANRGRGSAEKSASAGGGNRFANTVTIRGFNVPFQNRMGFRSGGLVITPGSSIALGGMLDASNIERMEVVKGPNSLLYGIGVISGIVNVIPMRPLSEPRAAVDLKVGSHGFFRSTADLTGPLLRRGQHQLNYRLIGAYETRDDWTDYRSKALEYTAFQLDYLYGRKLNVFLEYQYGFTRFTGTGAQWIYDDLNNAFVNELRNPWDEQYNFSQDGTVPGLTAVRFEPDRRGVAIAMMGEADPDLRFLAGGAYPDSFRITGPDTYHQRKEHNLLANVELYATPDFTLSGGLFFTTAEEEEFALNARHFSNQANNFIIRSYLPTRYDELGKSEFAHLLWGLSNPVAPLYTSSYDITRVNGQDDLKLTRYWWSMRPRSTESFQWRLRGNYRFDADLPLLGPTRHNILAGYHYINDNVDFLDGTENVNRAFIDRQHPYVTSGRVSMDDAPFVDGLYFRAIDDQSVFRYNGEQLVMPGTRYRNQDIWFHGAYAIYQFKLFNDKLAFLAGLRYDRYNADTRTYDRVSPAEAAIGLTDERWVDNPYSTTYGYREEFRNFANDVDSWSKTFAVNYEINRDWTVYALYSEGIAPNTALTDGNNETIPAERSVSREVGVKWDLWEGRLSGGLAFYKIERANAIWDFDDAPAPSKWAGSPHPPANFFFAGSEFNPYPTNGYLLNYGVDSAFVDNALVRLRATNFVTVSTSGEPGRSKAWYIQDPVTGELTRLAALYEIENHSAGSRQPFNRRDIWWLDYDQLDQKQSITVHVPDSNGDIVGPDNRRYRLQTVEINWRAYLEEAFNARELSADNPGQFDPIRYINTANPDGSNSGGNNPSASRSSADGHTFVTFSDESVGFDIELIYSPLPNWQLVLNFAHTRREGKGAFGMVDFRDLNTGLLYAGTEYDNVVRIFGREAFGITAEDTDGDGYPDRFLDQHGNPISQANPLRMSEALGGIDGVSLFFNPENEASLLTKYTFTDGPLARLALTFGVKYQGSAQTSIPIGGRDLGANSFATPKAPDRWTFDAGLFYTLHQGRCRWRLSLNAYNLGDHRLSERTVAYVDPVTGRDVHKRTRILHAPRSFRAGLSLDF
jgi:outer membrane receptor protein involved in Fe transport